MNIKKKTTKRYTPKTDMFSSSNKNVSANLFIKASKKHNTRTENGALSNSTTGSMFVDQFGSAGSHRGRSLDVVFAEQSKLMGNNPVMGLRFAFYLRAISRKKQFRRCSKFEQSCC